MIAAHSDEIQNLFNATVGLLEGDNPSEFETTLPLYSNSLCEADIETIRVGLQRKLVYISPDVIPVVSTDKPLGDEPGRLKVAFKPKYVPDCVTSHWFVDINGEACWYFKVADKSAADELAGFFNLGDNRVKLEAISPEHPVEVDSLKLWLLILRDRGVQVLKYGYKSTGHFDHLDQSMHDLTG